MAHDLEIFVPDPGSLRKLDVLFVLISWKYWKIDIFSFLVSWKYWKFKSPTFFIILEILIFPLSTALEMRAGGSFG